MGAGFFIPSTLITGGIRCGSCWTGKNDHTLTGPFWRTLDTLVKTMFFKASTFSHLTRSSGTASSGQWRTCSATSGPVEFLGKATSGFALVGSENKNNWKDVIF